MRIYFCGKVTGASYAPLGLGHLCGIHPQLALWAALFRRFAAGSTIRALIAAHLSIGASPDLRISRSAHLRRRLIQLLRISAFGVPTLRKARRVGQPGMNCPTQAKGRLEWATRRGYAADDTCASGDTIVVGETIAIARFDLKKGEQTAQTCENACSEQLIQQRATISLSCR